MYYVYILYNARIDRHYIGYTGNLEQRLADHKRGKSKGQYTKNQRGQWNLVYVEKYSNEQEAIQREQQIKVKKSRKYILQLLKKRQ